MPSKIVPCVDCGREFPRKELNRHFRCHDCAWEALRSNWESLREHAGPSYEKWKAGIQSAVNKL